MRWFDVSPRRATPKGHQSFISCTAPRSVTPLPHGNLPRSWHTPDAEHLLLPLHGDPDRQVRGLVLHAPAVTDLAHERVQEDHWVDRVERAGLPVLHLLEHRV